VTHARFTSMIHHYSLRVEDEVVMDGTLSRSLRVDDLGEKSALRFGCNQTP